MRREANVHASQGRMYGFIFIFLTAGGAHDLMKVAVRVTSCIVMRGGGACDFILFMRGGAWGH